MSTHARVRYLTARARVSSDPGNVALLRKAMDFERAFVKAGQLKHDACSHKVLERSDEIGPTDLRRVRSQNRFDGLIELYSIEVSPPQ